ncbi:3-methyl-2-oxobutanoate hydroxymethyltransferase [Candidatus Fermentibacteria bacterium]|nr:3-methyl-2-oxobutanoate hydroxymethyltransferase [Candidatus Fermentibacteria bacterium]
MTDSGKASVKTLVEMKKQGRKIVALTAYDYQTAVLEQKAGVDFILVGDSLAMAVLGEPTTLSVRLEVMLAHTRAVKLGAPDTLVVGDMPFGSYEESDELAVRSAVRFLSEGKADAVKLEGGNRLSRDRVAAIIESGIPVMGHIGLLPQSIRLTGGYKVVRSDQRERMLEEAGALEKAGAFCIIAESVQEPLAREIAESVEVPVVGIGAGRYVDGQILVVNDILGLTPGFKPRFLKRYAELSQQVEDAVRRYTEEVREGIFPDKKHSYGVREDS